MRIKFENANIITCNESFEIIKGDLVVCDNVIESVGEKVLGNFDRVIDCNFGILMPGLINCYANLNLGEYKGKICNNSIDELYDNLNTSERTLTSTDAYNSKVNGCLELIKNGVTCVADFGRFNNEFVKSLSKTKIRGVVPVGVFDDDEIVDFKTIENQINKIKYIKDVDIVLYVKNMYNLEELQYIDLIKLCKKYNLTFITSASETLFDVGECVNKNECTPIELLESYGMFDGECSLINAVNVDKDEMDILKNYNVNVISTPSSNLQTGAGVAPIFSYLNKGINVALGTGYSALTKLDILNEINLLSLLQKGVMHNSKIIEDKDAILASTINSAKALGLSKIGVLQKGYFADIILVDGSNIIPLNNIAKNIVNFANASNIKLTMINGEILYENGRFTNI